MIERVAATTLIAVVVAAAALGACGDDSTAFNATSSGDPGSTTGGGGTGGTGTAVAMGGAGGSGTGGDGGAGGDEPDCPHTGPPVIDPSTLDECGCDGAHCVPAALVPADQQSQLAPCQTGGGDGFCTPDKFIETAGLFIAETCTSVGGAEGRCLSDCLVAVASQAALLPVDICDPGERCAPCFDPFTQEDTGACTLSCDPGPTEPPLMIDCPYNGPPLIDPNVLDDCSPACNGAHCLPTAFVPTDLQALLTPCAGGFCAPDTLIESGGQGIPVSCTSAAGAEGRCLSTCLPDIAAQANLLPVDVCNPDERCAPCFNPIATDPNLPTGACEIACDTAVDPPVIITCPWNGPAVLDPSVLPDCSPACGGAHCLEASLVPPSLQSQVAPCPGGFCVPDPMIAAAGNYLPPTCNAFSGTSAEGRCLSECLPAVISQIDQLQQDTCAAGERCAPCTDPFTGVPTGACTTVSCDMPANPPYTFPTCCPNSSNVDEATCLPTALVPAGQAGQLLQQACPSGLLCVPNEYLPGSPGIPLCNSALGQGACVSDCVDLGLGGIFGQSNCTDNHTCVPCLFGPPGCP